MVEELIFLFAMALQAISGVGRLFLRFLEHTQLEKHTHPGSLFRMSDQLVAEAATYTTHNKYRTSMSSAGFVPAIPAYEGLQVYVLDLTATGIGN